MPRSLRVNGKDTWHHLTNRSVGQGAIFEDPSEIRFFLSRVARAVAAGVIQVHTFVVMPNHFHILLRSVTGELSRTFQWIQSEFASRFNVRRERSGHLFGGRFYSGEVVSATHWENIVRYIDNNPVRAGLVSKPEDYPYGGAWHYSRPKGPPWLTRSIVEAIAEYAGGYAEAFRGGNPRFIASLVESRLREACGGGDPLDALAGGSIDSTSIWLQERARNAVRLPQGPVFADPISLRVIVDELRAEAPDWKVPGVAKCSPGWGILLSGLTRMCCGASLREVALRSGCSISAAQRRARRFHQLLKENREVAELSARILMRALSQDIPPRVADPEILGLSGSLGQTPERAKSSVQT